MKNPGKLTLSDALAEVRRLRAENEQLVRMLKMPDDGVEADIDYLQAETERLRAENAKCADERDNMRDAIHKLREGLDEAMSVARQIEAAASWSHRHTTSKAMRTALGANESLVARHRPKAEEGK